MNIYYYDTGKQNGYLNMAIDEMLLSSKETVLRIYRWKDKTLSIGKNQKLRDIDIDYCKKNEISIVRRMTGGKAVLHDDELTYSFILDKKLVSRSVPKSYKQICMPLVKALNSLGIDATISGSKKINSANPVCFGELSTNEIQYQRKKLIGSAQARIADKVLQHGSILFSLDFGLYSGCFSKKYFNSTFRERIATLKSIKNISQKKLIKNIRKEFSKAFNAKIIDKKLTKDQMKRSEALVLNKYKTKKWNMMQL